VYILEQYETRQNIDEKILKVYNYGSRVYGCNTENSDYDFIIIVESDKDLYYTVEKVNCNITVYSESMFIKRIKEHNISVLECIFQFKNDPYLEHFNLNKERLRRSISGVSSNSFVKCKKKLAQGDYYIGKKSLFHSLRILGFGIQIALTGRIIDYSAYNHYLEEIMDMDTNDWETYKMIFKPIFNRMKTNFRVFAPLESEINE
jgi:predicted nucleotidyltransferase